MQQTTEQEQMPNIAELERKRAIWKGREAQRKLIDEAYQLTGFTIREFWKTNEFGLVLKRRHTAKEIQEFFLGKRKISWKG